MAASSRLRTVYGRAKAYKADISTLATGTSLPFTVGTATAATHAVTLAQLQQRAYSVKDAAFGALGDAVYLHGGVTTSGSATVTSANGNVFTAGMAGKTFVAIDPATPATKFSGTVLSVADAGASITLVANATASITSAVLFIGTDDTAAFTAAIAAAVAASAAAPGSLFPVLVPSGCYLLTSALTLSSGVVLHGSGPSRAVEQGTGPLLLFPSSSALDNAATVTGIDISGLQWLGDGSHGFFTTAAGTNGWTTDTFRDNRVLGFTTFNWKSTAGNLIRNSFNKFPAWPSGYGVVLGMSGSDWTAEYNLIDGQYYPYSNDAGSTANFLVTITARKYRFVNNYITGSTVQANYGAIGLYLHGSGGNNDAGEVLNNVIEFCQGPCIFAQTVESTAIRGNVLTNYLKSAFGAYLAAILFDTSKNIDVSGNVFRTVLPSTRAFTRFINSCVNVYVHDNVYDGTAIPDTGIAHQQRNSSTGCRAFEPSRPGYMTFPLTANLSADGADSGREFYNTHASSQWIVTLPAGLVGMEYSFRSEGAAGIKATPATGETIRGGTANQTASLTGAGNGFRLKCYVAGTWTVVSSVGTITYA